MTKERAQYIDSVHTCSLCSTVPLQLCTTDDNRPEKKDQLVS